MPRRGFLGKVTKVSTRFSGDMGFDSQESSQIVFDFRDSRAFLVWFLGA